MAREELVFDGYGKGLYRKDRIFLFLVCGATIENIGWLAKISAYFNLKDKVKHGKTRIQTKRPSFSSGSQTKVLFSNSNNLARLEGVLFSLIPVLRSYRGFTQKQTDCSILP